MTATTIAADAAIGATDRDQRIPTTPAELAAKLFTIKNYEMSPEEQEVYILHHCGIEKMNCRRRDFDERQFDGTPHPINTVQFRLEDGVITGPAKKHADDAGYDFAAYCKDPIEILPHCTVKIPTGVHIRPPTGYYFQIQGRSGLAKRGLTPLGGVVDEGYTGEVCVLLYNSDDELTFVVRNGDRIAQLVMQKTYEKIRVEYLSVTDSNPGEDTKTSRGANGFGSTGV